MGKKYIMFVDERGFLNMNASKNITLIGIIFEYDYCVSSKNKESELSEKLQAYKEAILNNCRNIPFDDIFLNENVYKNIAMVERNKFISELPAVIKSLKFTIISSTIKYEFNKSLDYYAVATKRLLNKYYSFILRKNGESGGIIMEARNEKASYKMQQNFFNIYVERNLNLDFVGNIQDKINTFIVCEKNSKNYGACIELSNILNYIIYRVYSGYREIDKKLISFMKYRNKNKIFDSIKHKIYKDTEIAISINQPQIVENNNIEKFNKELEALKEQLLLKDIKINEKEKEVNELNNEIKFLSQQLKKILLNRGDDSIISRIFLDIDVNMKRSDKVSTVAEN